MLTTKLLVFVKTPLPLSLQEEQVLGDTAHVVGAFVTFRNESSKLTCLRATPRSWIRQHWLLKPEHKFRRR